MSVAKEQQHAGALATRLVLNALTAVKNGDFFVRLPTDWTGVNGKIADTFNDISPQNERIAEELERVSRTRRPGGSGRQTIATEYRKGIPD